MKSFRSFLLTAPLLSGPVLFAAEPAAHTPVLLDTVVVSATPLERTLFEQAQPISILSGEPLRLKLQPTLGDTLASTPGVSSSYFGPGAGRPIIRGLDGDRIRVLQNGVNTIDASATSVDHAVSFDPANVERIEVVRGPATLFYGPSAIGGVVNVIDGRIPETRIETLVRGNIAGRYGSVNTERAGSFTLEGGLGGFAWHLEGYKTATLDLSIPGYARSAALRARDPLPPGEKEAYGVLPNSALRTEGLSGGASYIWDRGFFGAAYSGFHTNYGTVAEPTVTIDMEQRRFDARGAFFDPFPLVKAINYRFGAADYQHTEFEGAETGTIFKNEGYDGRVEILHHRLGLFEGGLGYQTERSDFSALGEEAFLPPVVTTTHSVFVFEEMALDPVRVQFGIRYDHITADASADPAFGPARSRTFNDLSGSLGLVYTPTEAYAVALSASYSQRAPTYQELYADGPHVATGAFEVGDAALPVEKSLALDLTLRKKTGRVTGALSLFYTGFTDYIGLFATGRFDEGAEEPLPVYDYAATSAQFFGGELEVVIHLLELDSGKDAKSAPAPSRPHPRLDLELKADYVNATDLAHDRPLPRIPPFRASAALAWSYDRLGARIETQFAARQNRTADFELPTEAYYLLNASLTYRLSTGPVAWDVFLKGTNLTNQEARLSTSFLKDIAPLGGRGIALGLKAEF